MAAASSSASAPPLSKGELEGLILRTLAEGSIDNSRVFLDSLGNPSVDHDFLVGVLNSLLQDDYVELTSSTEPGWKLSAEAQEYLQHGSPECQLLNLLSPGEGKTVAQLMAEGNMEESLYKIAFGKCMRNKWVELNKGGAEPMVVRKPNVESVDDELQSQLKQVVSGRAEELGAKTLTELQRRTLLIKSERTVFAVTKGPKFAIERVKLPSEITSDMLSSGAWETTELKKFNTNALGKAPRSGYLHPLLKARSEIREIFLEMGFEEMQTDRFVESAFWNFDALFQPQQHPARDMHDTFYLKHPAATPEENLPAEYLAEVKKMHESGGHGSLGYRYNWKVEEAQKNILRTHTTAVSSRVLKSLAEEPEFRPRKFFSIDRVFRNEDMDATHLCEFHQMEGMVIDRNINLGHMIGLFTDFFARIGVKELRFKPAYNPYTEPSMEIFGFHEGLGKLVEIGNSGIFRPEMLRPMGLPEDVNVIAWGLSLERPTMIRYGINNIRDLIGPKVDLNMIKNSPVCRLDKY